MTLVKVNNPQKSRNGFGLSPLFDEVFNDLIHGGSSFKSALAKNVAVNIQENESDFQLEFAAPGFDKADFKINIDNKNLTVSAEKKTEVTEKEKNYSRKEFSYNSFSRNFTLPENINEEGIKAEYKNGILFVELPKLTEAKKAVKEISVA
ncbi:MAG: Hsp20/alpha crystallin family protein [Bacteroidetes bacterium]|jgi:HSP20 family protein|nr:Hsp20/alpha crystallin family protein [Bacteroidota bacterium]